MNHLGQASIESLSIYGWVLLIIVVAIAAIAFFGVLTPSKYLTPSCELIPAIRCNDFRVEAVTSTLTILVQNIAGADMQTIQFALGAGDTPNTQRCSGSGDIVSAGLNPPFAYGSEIQIPISLTCQSPLTAGSKFQAKINVTYSIGTSGASIQSQGFGLITAQIE